MSRRKPRLAMAGMGRADRPASGVFRSRGLLLHGPQAVGWVKLPLNSAAMTCRLASWSRFRIAFLEILAKRIYRGCAPWPRSWMSGEEGRAGTAFRARYPRDIRGLRRNEET